MKQNEKFLRVYKDILEKGRLIENPHGTDTLELINYQFLVPTWPYILTSYRARKLNLEYCKKEWVWYLNADRYDTSIEEYATLWKKIRQDDGGYNSNYGQYIFGEGQFLWAANCLVEDIYSRQACIQLLNRSHQYRGNTDVVCTMGIQFLIRDGYLNMYVNMRSNDAIYGLTNDVFCFANLHRMMYMHLKSEKYSMLGMGKYYHRAGSLHVYKRHFDMLKSLVEEGIDGYEHIDIPYPTSIEDFYALADPDTYYKHTSEYTQWMRS